jgi:anti-sigma factor RsiW
MKPELENQRINAFVDGELDLKDHLEMEERVRQEGAVRDVADSIRQLREAIRDGADYHAAPATLRARLQAALGAPTALPAKKTKEIGPSAVAAAVWRWLAWRPLVASLGFVGALAAALNLYMARSAQEDRLLDGVVASHVRSTLGQHLIDVASSDRHTVKPWLSSKLDFSPPVSELAIPGSALLGGRVDYLDNRPVAALVYKQGEHVVNSYIWPGAAGDSKPQFALVRGFQTAHWTHAGMNHWVISDVNRQEFATIVEAIQQTETTR